MDGATCGARRKNSMRLLWTLRHQCRQRDRACCSRGNFANWPGSISSRAESSRFGSRMERLLAQIYKQARSVTRWFGTHAENDWRRRRPQNQSAKHFRTFAFFSRRNVPAFICLLPWNRLRFPAAKNWRLGCLREPSEI